MIPARRCSRRWRPAIRRTPIALVVLGASSSRPGVAHAALTPDSRLTHRGLGPIEIGMTERQAERAGDPTTLVRALVQATGELQSERAPDQEYQRPKFPPGLVGTLISRRRYMSRNPPLQKPTFDTRSSAGTLPG